MSDDNENKKKVSPEFITCVKKYIEIDDILKEIKEKVKKLNTDKKTNEEFILDYLMIFKTLLVVIIFIRIVFLLKYDILIFLFSVLMG